MYTYSMYICFAAISVTDGTDTHTETHADAFSLLLSSLVHYISNFQRLRALRDEIVCRKVYIRLRMMADIEQIESLYLSHSFCVQLRECSMQCSMQRRQWFWLCAFWNAKRL